MSSAGSAGDQNPNLSVFDCMKNVPFSCFRILQTLIGNKNVDKQMKLNEMISPANVLGPLYAFPDFTSSVNILVI